MTRKSSSLQGLECGIFLIILFISVIHSAPVHENDQTDLEVYDEQNGCYYNYNHYGEGDRIMTNEPCLNCTCHNKMLMCYLRVCPFTKPIGQDCTIEKREDQCCPVITCPEVPVELVTHVTTSSTDLAAPEQFGCSINNKFYSEGAQVPSHPHKPCELCYCIRNMTACVMQECTLHVEGCQPIYNKGVCCPVRYSCDHDSADDLLQLEDATTTTVRPTPGFVLTMTTTLTPIASTDCTYNEEVFGDGAMIMTDKPCEHCYCMRGDIVCAVQECGTPLENEGKNCTAMAPRDGQCCPDTYICDGSDIEHNLLVVGDMERGSEDSTTQSMQMKPVHKDEAAPTTVRVPAPVTHGAADGTKDEDLQHRISEVTGVFEEHGTTKGPKLDAGLPPVEEEKEKQADKDSHITEAAVTDATDVRKGEAPVVQDDSEEKSTESSDVESETNKYATKLPFPSADEDGESQIQLTESPESVHDTQEKLTEAPETAVQHDDKTESVEDEHSTEKSKNEDATDDEDKQEHLTEGFVFEAATDKIEQPSKAQDEVQESATDKAEKPSKAQVEEQDLTTDKTEEQTEAQDEEQDSVTDKIKMPSKAQDGEQESATDKTEKPSEAEEGEFDSATSKDENEEHESATNKAEDEESANDKTEKPSQAEEEVHESATDKAEKPIKSEEKEQESATDKIEKPSKAEDEEQESATDKVKKPITSEEEENESATDSSEKSSEDEDKQHESATDKIDEHDVATAVYAGNEQAKPSHSDRHDDVPEASTFKDGSIDDKPTQRPAISDDMEPTTAKHSDEDDSIEQHTESAESDDHTSKPFTSSEIETGDHKTEEKATEEPSLAHDEVTSQTLDEDSEDVQKTEKTTVVSEEDKKDEEEDEQKTEKVVAHDQYETTEHGEVHSEESTEPDSKTESATDSHHDDESHTDSDELDEQHTIAPQVVKDTPADKPSDHVEETITSSGDHVTADYSGEIDISDEHKTESPDHDDQEGSGATTDSSDLLKKPESEISTDAPKSPVEQDETSYEQDEHTTVAGAAVSSADKQADDVAEDHSELPETGLEHDDVEVTTNAEHEDVSGEEDEITEGKKDLGEAVTESMEESTHSGEQDKFEATTQFADEESEGEVVDDDHKEVESTTDKRADGELGSRYDDTTDKTEEAHKKPSMDVEFTTLGAPEGEKKHDATESAENTGSHEDDKHVTERDDTSDEIEATTPELDNEIHETMPVQHKPEKETQTGKVESTTGFAESDEASTFKDTTAKHEDEDLQEHIDEDDVHKDAKKPQADVEDETQRPTYLPPYTTGSSEDDQTTDSILESSTETVKGTAGQTDAQEKVDKLPEKAVKPEKSDKPEKADKPETSEHPEKADKKVPTTTVGHDDLELPEREIVTEVPHFTDIPLLPEIMEGEMDTKSPLESDSHTLDDSMTTETVVKKVIKPASEKTNDIPEEPMEMNTIIPSGEQEQSKEESTEFGVERTTVPVVSSEDEPQSIGTLFPSSEETSDEAMFPSSVPGEGNCLLDGNTYANNSMIPPRTPCQMYCICSSSIIRCESVQCAPPPTTNANCVPVFTRADQCCPTYNCAIPDAGIVVVTPELITGAKEPVELTTVSSAVETETKLAATEEPMVIKEIAPDMKQKDEVEEDEVTASVEEIKPTTEGVKDMYTGLHGIEKATKSPITKGTTQAPKEEEQEATTTVAEQEDEHTDKSVEEPVTTGYMTDSHVKESEEETETEKSVHHKISTSEGESETTDKTIVEPVTAEKAGSDESDEEMVTEKITLRPGLGIKGKPVKTVTKATAKPVVESADKESATPSIFDTDFTTVSGEIEESTGLSVDTDERGQFEEETTEKSGKPEEDKPVIIKDETAVTDRLPYDEEFDKEVATAKPSLDAEPHAPSETSEKEIIPDINVPATPISGEQDEYAATDIPTGQKEPMKGADDEIPTTHLPYDDEYEKEVATAKPSYDETVPIIVEEEKTSKPSDNTDIEKSTEAYTTDTETSRPTAALAPSKDDKFEAPSVTEHDDVESQTSEPTVEDSSSDEKESATHRAPESMENITDSPHSGSEEGETEMATSKPHIASGSSEENKQDSEEVTTLLPTKSDEKSSEESKEEEAEKSATETSPAEHDEEHVTEMEHAVTDKVHDTPTATDVYEDEVTTESSDSDKHDDTPAIDASEEKDKDLLEHHTTSVTEKLEDEPQSTDMNPELSYTTETVVEHDESEHAATEKNHELPSSTDNIDEKSEESTEEAHELPSATEKSEASGTSAHDMQETTEKEHDLVSATEKQDDKDHELPSATEVASSYDEPAATTEIGQESDKEDEHQVPSATDSSSEEEKENEKTTDSADKESDLPYTTETSHPVDSEHGDANKSAEHSTEKVEDHHADHGDADKSAEQSTEKVEDHHKDEEQLPEITTAGFVDEDFEDKHPTQMPEVDSHVKLPESEDSVNRGDEFEVGSTRRPALHADELEKTTAKAVEEEPHHSTESVVAVGVELVTQGTPAKQETTQKPAKDEATQKPAKDEATQKPILLDDHVEPETHDDGTTASPQVPVVADKMQETSDTEPTKEDEDGTPVEDEDEGQHEEKPVHSGQKPVSHDDEEDNSYKPISFGQDGDDEPQKPIDNMYNKRPTESGSGSHYGSGSGAGGHFDTGSGYPAYPPPSYGGGATADDDYIEEEDPAAFGPGTCRYGGKLYVSAQQIPRDDPCDFCFCFRSDIICLQQSCPPPISGCHEEPISGFCCPRYECPVSMATVLNVTTSTTTTTTTLPPHFMQHAYKGAATKRGCQIQGKAYAVGEDVASASGPCMRCTCGGDGQMKCDPKACSPEPMLRQMIAVAASRKR